MIKRLFKLLLLIVILLPFNVMAKCDDARLSDLSSIAGNVKFSTTYKIQDNMVLYNVELSNLTDDIYVIDSFDTVFTRAFTSIDYNFLNDVDYIIYSNDPNCYGERLLTKHIEVPIYNSFAGSDICKKYPGDSYCQLWSKSYFYIESDFVNAVSRRHLEVANESGNELKEDQDASRDNYLPIYIFSTVIFLTFVFILFVVRRKIKNVK